MGQLAGPRPGTSPKNRVDGAAIPARLARSDHGSGGEAVEKGLLGGIDTRSPPGRSDRGTYDSVDGGGSRRAVVGSAVTRGSRLRQLRLVTDAVLVRSVSAGPPSVPRPPAPKQGRPTADRSFSGVAPRRYARRPVHRRNWAACSRLAPIAVGAVNLNVRVADADAPIRIAW